MVSPTRPAAASCLSLVLSLASATAEEATPPGPPPAPADAVTPAEESVVEPEAEPDDTGSSLTFSGGVDIASAYYFRGIPQVTQGVVIQPYANLGISLVEQDEDVPVGLGLNFGTWNSLHSAQSTDPWYESDFTAGASLILPGGVTFGASYVYIYAPSLGDIFAEEIDLSLAIDEKKLLGIGETPLNFALSPSALVAFEVDGGSDGLGVAGAPGIYLELGLAPSITLDVIEGYPITLAVPLKVGLSIDDYYESSVGGDETFGYFDATVAATVPLSFIPPRFGSWSLTGTVHFLFLGDSVQNIGEVDFRTYGGEDFRIYTLWGVKVQ